MTRWNCVTYFRCVCCVFLLQELNENSEKNPEEDEAFAETNWSDFTYGYSSKIQKKVMANSLMVIFNKYHPVTERNNHCFVFFSFSGPIGLDPCAVAFASTRHKTSTTSGAMSLGAMQRFRLCARWRRALSASSSATLRLSRSTYSSSTPSLLSTHNLKRMGLRAAIEEMRGISAENVGSRAPLSSP